MVTDNLDNAVVTIGKEELAVLPAASYSGRITVIDSVEKIKAAVKVLRQAKLIGFDTETKPSFKKGKVNSVALIQLATTDEAFLFRTNIIGFPEEVIGLLEDKKLLKIGLSLRDDFHNLQKLGEFNPQGFVDLQTYVKEFRIADAALSRLYGILFDKRICKNQRLSNWEASELTESQQLYAALDAAACLDIYQFLHQGNFKPEESKYLIVPEPANTDIQADTKV